MKRLVIINGSTGPIGGACFAHFSGYPENTIYCLSRTKGWHYTEFITNGVMPDATLACSVGEDLLNGCHTLLDRINFSLYDEVVYIHAIGGQFLFEFSSSGAIKVTNDYDNDGINDTVAHLIYDLFVDILTLLMKKHVRVRALIFGGLSDRYEPLVHQSWWKTIKKVKTWCVKTVAKNKNVDITLLNISSVRCFGELASRPVVFRDTDAKSQFWLMPHEVAEKVYHHLTVRDFRGFYEDEFYHPSTYYQPGYYLGEQFTARKKRELGIP